MKRKSIKWSGIDNEGYDLCVRLGAEYWDVIKSSNGTWTVACGARNIRIEGLADREAGRLKAEALMRQYGLLA